MVKWRYLAVIAGVTFLLIEYRGCSRASCPVSSGPHRLNVPAGIYMFWCLHQSYLGRFWKKEDTDCFLLTALLWLHIISKITTVMFDLGLAAHVHFHPLPQQLLQAAALQHPGGAQDASMVEEGAPGYNSAHPQQGWCNLMNSLCSLIFRWFRVGFCWKNKRFLYSLSVFDVIFIAAFVLTAFFLLNIRLL